MAKARESEMVWCVDCGKEYDDEIAAFMCCAGEEDGDEDDGWIDDEPRGTGRLSRAQRRYEETGRF